MIPFIPFQEAGNIHLPKMFMQLPDSVTDSSHNLIPGFFFPVAQAQVDLFGSKRTG